MQNWQRMASDRLTQLQDAVNLQAENFCNSIGVLQMYAKESPFAEFNSINKQNQQQQSQSCNATNNNNNNNQTNNGDNVNSVMLDNSNNSLAKDHIKTSSTATVVTSSSSSKSCLNGSTTSLIGQSPQQSTGKDILMEKLTAKTNNTTSSNNNKQSNEHENSQLFARLIARTAKDIDTLIESLPNTFETESGSSDIHSGSIRQLENDNARCIIELEAVIRRGESLLELIQNALDEIARMQLKSQTLDNFV